MRKLCTLTFLLLIALGASWNVSADQVTLTGVGNTIWQGVYAGPYTATLNGSPITMICVSFDRHETLGQTWQATSNLLTASGIADALYGAQANALQKYQEAAWLYDQVSLHPNQSGDIQGAIWNIFNPAATPDTAGSRQWLSLAQSQNLTGYDFSKFRILTPSDHSAKGPQENLTTVPEPASMLLLGTGLAAIASRLRKRRRAPAGEVA